jgi:hypothetical protein
MRPTHLPHELSLATNPPGHYIPPPRMPAEVDYDTSITRSSLRHNQILPAASLARGPPEQSHYIPPPVRHEVHGHQQFSYPTGPGTHLVEARAAIPPEAPPTPDLDLRHSRTLYLTNPDERPNAPGHRSRAPPLPPAPEGVSPPRRRRSERPTQNPLDSFVGAQPQVVAPNATTQTEVRRRTPPRSSPPVASTDHRKEAPRHYEPPSQALAAINAQRVGVPVTAMSASSSHSSSSLTPRHIPKRLVMPTPLASTAQIAPQTVRSEGSLPSAISSRANGGRPAQLLRKRSVPGVMSRPQPAQASAPSETVNRGVFSFFGFGKGSKPTVREVRVTEPTKRAMNEKHELPVRTREEPRKLSKRR